MTVPTTDSKSGPYSGNGSNVYFPFEYKILEEDHLEVILTDANGVETVQTLNVHYTVDGVGNDNGGTVTMVTAPASGELLTVRRLLDLTQETDLMNQGEMHAEVHETVFDRLTMMIQQVYEEVTRAVRTAVSSDANLEFPSPEANKVIGWDGSATELVNYDNLGVLDPPDLTIAVIGASESVYPWDFNHVAELQDALIDAGLNIKVVNASVGGAAFNTAMTGTQFPGSKSAYDYVVDTVQPDICIVILGVNGGQTGVAPATTIADATTLFNALKTNLPACKTVFGKIITWDKLNFPGATDVTKQHAVVPYLAGTSQAVGEAGLATSSATDLNVNLASTEQTYLNNWRTAAAAIEVLSSVDHVIEYDAFRIARLGLMGDDRFHPAIHGQKLFLAYEWDFMVNDSAWLTDFPLFANVPDNFEAVDPDAVWTSAVEPSGDAWVTNSANWFAGAQENDWPVFISGYGDDERIATVESWANYQKPLISVPPDVLKSVSTEHIINIQGLWPGLEVKKKWWLDGSGEPATFAPFTPPRYTTDHGGWIEVGDMGAKGYNFANGDYWLKYSIGAVDVLGPFKVTLSGTEPAYGFTPAVATMRVTTAKNQALSPSTIAVTYNILDRNDAPALITPNLGTGVFTLANEVAHFRVVANIDIDLTDAVGLSPEAFGYLEYGSATLGGIEVPAFAMHIENVASGSHYTANLVTPWIDKPTGSTMDVVIKANSIAAVDISNLGTWFSIEVLTS